MTAGSLASLYAHAASTRPAGCVIANPPGPSTPGRWQLLRAVLAPLLAVLIRYRPARRSLGSRSVTVGTQSSIRHLRLNTTRRVRVEICDHRVALRSGC
jgi:hypothetical protein